MSKTKDWMPKAERRLQILDAAVALAAEDDYRNLTKRGVAERAGVSPSLVMAHFNTMTQMRRAVLRHAISHEIAVVVGQGLAARDPHAVKAPEELKRRATGQMMGDL